MRKGQLMLLNEFYVSVFVNGTAFAPSRSAYTGLRKAELTKYQGANCIKKFSQPNEFALNVLVLCLSGREREELSTKYNGYNDK